MDPNQPGSSNPDQPNAAAPRTSATTMPAGTPIFDPGPPARKAQSEIGPTTYGGPNGPVNHGPNDPETKAAYAAGHPSDGIANQRARTAAGMSQTAAGTAQPAGATNPAGQPNAPQPGTQRVRMVRDDGGHTNGQHLDLPADEAQRLISSGAAQAV